MGSARGRGAGSAGGESSRGLSRFSTMLAVASWATSMGCGSLTPDYTPEPSVLGEGQSAVAACDGDDLQYDFNAFAASLAVAIANEMGRWDVAADFELDGDRLRLSSTGLLHCSNGCDNVEALLALQGDETNEVPYHNPALFRSKLAGWYTEQQQRVSELVQGMLHLDKGVYRIRSKHSGMTLTVGDAVEDKWRRRSWSNGWTIPTSTEEQSSAPAATERSLIQAALSDSSTADRFEVVLEGTTHVLRHVDSGLCMDLADDLGSALPLRVRTCDDSSTQRFRFSKMDENSFAIRTSHLQALNLQYSTSSGAAPIQSQLEGGNVSMHFAFEPVGSAAHEELDAIANAVYSLTVGHSGQALGVRSGSAASGAAIEQRHYDEEDDRYHWYVHGSNSRYQLVNRRSGLCLDLSDPNSPNGALVQRECSEEQSQKFYVTPTGVGSLVLYSLPGRALEIDQASQSEGAPLVQSSGVSWDTHRYISLQPIMAGEPHRLTYSHTTADGPCGDYFWYDIQRPNGEMLEAPESTYVQLMFAGGKSEIDGVDDNPFIAQLVSGSQVAVDPLSYMSSSTSLGTGSCTKADIVYDSTRRAQGACCIKYNGAYGSFSRSSWSSTTFLCR